MQVFKRPHRQGPVSVASWIARPAPGLERWGQEPLADPRPQSPRLDACAFAQFFKCEIILFHEAKIAI